MVIDESSILPLMAALAELLKVLVLMMAAKLGWAGADRNSGNKMVSMRGGEVVAEWR